MSCEATVVGAPRLRRVQECTRESDHLLADFAQVADGKLTVVGGGWSLTGPEPTPFGIAILVHVPWDQANRRHTLRLELVDADGQPVMFPVDGEEEERQSSSSTTSSSRSGARPGSSPDASRAAARGQLGAARARAGRTLRVAAVDRRRRRRGLATRVQRSAGGRADLTPGLGNGPLARPPGAGQAAVGGADVVARRERPTTRRRTRARAAPGSARGSSPRKRGGSRLPARTRCSPARPVSAASTSRSNSTSMWSETKPMGESRRPSRRAAAARRWSTLSGSSQGTCGGPLRL